MKPRRLIGIFCAAAAVAGAGVFLWDRTLGPSTAQTAPPQPPLVTVATPLVKQVTDFDEFTGRFEPTATVEIRPRVSGYLTEINFSDGQIVESGQALFVIDRRPYETALAQAEAQLSGAKAQLTFAEADERRSQQLVKTSNIAVATHEQRVQTRRAAQAALQSAEAAVSRARLDLDFTEVRSPVRGRVSNRRVDLGNLVVGDGASTVLTTVVAQDRLYFVFDISEGDLLARRRAPGASARDALGLGVQARHDGESDWPRAGKLDFLDNRLQAGSGTIRARATFENADGALTPGQFGRIRLPRGPAYEAVMIPETAVMNDQYKKVALVLDDKNVVRQRQLTLGPVQPGGLIIVRSGVGAGDRVVVNGLMQAKPNQPARPQPGSIEADDKPLS
ncbi:efflux RND transporter periplasmic adaptor subunit [Methylopila sp. M107]|uniref:efflux RND transporter periplasmic adaptor subunit n=1 Tax=Methylopila sp. M107 TaxID=1101190 RepID=UPI000364FC87|nr:efflux RND transporter periplasmic adaptor subunit [Methylopila sp. M107]